MDQYSLCLGVLIFLGIKNTVIITPLPINNRYTGGAITHYHIAQGLILASALGKVLKNFLDARTLLTR